MTKFTDVGNEHRQSLRARLECTVLDYLCGQQELFTDADVEEILDKDDISEDLGIFINDLLNELGVKGDK